MVKVGLTGGIGSGKSTVADILKSLGFSVYNSDNRAKWIMNNNDNLKSNIISIFGNNAYHKQTINRQHISNIVFNNLLKLKQLNALVHPLVSIDFENWLSNQKTNDLIFKEAAILIESGAYKEMDKTILVISPIHLRIQRVLERDGSNLESIKKRMQNQLTDDEKNNYVDFIIQNSGSKTELFSETELVISKLKKLKN